MNPANNRRQFLKYLAASPVCGALPGYGFAHDIENGQRVTNARDAIDVFDLQATAGATLPPAHYGYIATGVNADRTPRANCDTFAHYWNCMRTADYE